MNQTTDEFVRSENIAYFEQRLTTIPEGAEREMLLKLLAEERAKAPRSVAPPQRN